MNKSVTTPTCTQLNPTTQDWGWHLQLQDRPWAQPTVRGHSLRLQEEPGAGPTVRGQALGLGAGHGQGLRLGGRP